MSIRLMSQVWETSPYTHTMLLLHVAMADAANDEGEFYYKQETLAKKARVSVRYLREVTQRMVEDGYLETKRGRWGRLVYRLLTPQEGNSVPVPPEPSSGQRGTQFRSQGNSVPVTTEPSTEPSVEPSEEPVAPSGDDQRSEEHMPVYGSLDDDAEMPEGGKPVKPKKKFDSAPKAGTNGWLFYRFGQEQRQHNCGNGYMRGALGAAFTELRQEGYSNEEIEIMIRVFFARQEQNIRAKDIDVAIMFRAQINILKNKHAADQIRSHRRGDRPVVRDDEQKAILAQMGMTDA